MASAGTSQEMGTREQIRLSDSQDEPFSYKGFPRVPLCCLSRNSQLQSAAYVELTHPRLAVCGLVI